MRDGRPNPDIWGNIITCGEIAVGIYEIVGTKKRGLEVPKALAEEILPESVMEQAAQDGENLCFTDPVSNAIVADALLEQELVTDPQAAARLDAIRQLDDVTYDNLASWLAARGAEVAYIEVNQNRHLQLLLNIYEAAPDGEHYTIDGIDCYLTNEPDKAYQFIIYDCGVMQTPTSIFRDADHRLLCGSVLPYEIPVFHKALSECGSLEVRPVAICVPQEIQEYCMELFGENVQIAAASHDLFAKRVNGQIYRPLVEKYIAGEKRL